MSPVLTAVAVVCAVALLFFVAGFVGFRRVFTRARKRTDKSGRGEPWSSYWKELTDAKRQLTEEGCRVLTLKRGKTTLVGYYVDSKSDRTAVLLHGWHDEAALRMNDVRSYADMGYNVFLPDLRGHGDSGGAFVGFGADRDDVIAWIEELVRLHGEQRVVLSGVSMGAATVCLLTGDDDLPSCVRAAVSDCSYTSLKELFNVTAGEYPGFLWRPVAFFMDVWRRLLCGRSIDADAPIVAVTRSKTPTLFVHGTKDGLIPCRMCTELYDACSAEKAVLYVEGAVHTLSSFADRPLYERTVRSFLEKYV